MIERMHARSGPTSSAPYGVANRYIPLRGTVRACRVFTCGISLSNAV